MKDWIQKNSVRAKVIYYLFLVLIVLSYDTIRFGDNKKKLNSSFSVELRYPSASIESLIERIVIPLEEKLSTVSGIESIFSRIENGKAFIFLETNLNARIEKEIRGILETQYNKFPTDANRPILEKSSMDENPSIIYSIDMNQVRIQEAINQIKAMKGIERVIVYGEQKKEIQVDCDSRNLSSRKINIERIQSILQDNNNERVIEKVFIDNKINRIYLKTTLNSLTSISELEIEPKIKLKNFCRVFEDLAKQNTATRKNLKEKVSVYIYFEEDNKKFYFNEIQKIFYENNIDFEEIFNESRETSKSLAKLIISLLLILTFRLFIINYHKIRIISIEKEIFLLTNNLLIFIIFLGVFSNKATELNLLMIQTNYLFCRNENCGIRTRFVLGVLIGFLGIGALDFEITVNLFLFFCLYITTDFHHYFYEFHVNKLLLGKTFNYTIIKMIRTTILSYLKIFEKIQSYKFFERIKKFFDIIVNSNFIKSSMKIFIILSGLIILDRIYILETRNNNSSTVWGTLEMGTGTSFIETDAISRKIEAEFLNFAEVRNIFAKIEKDQAKYQIELKPNIEFTSELELRLKELGNSIEDGFLYYQKNRDKSKNEIELWISGEDWNRLDQYCKKVISRIKKHPKVKDAFLKYKTPKRDIELEIDSKKVHEIGTNVNSISNKIRNYNSGLVIGKFFDGKEILDVWLKGKNFSKKNLYDSDLQIIDSKLKIKTISEEKEISKADKVYRKNREMILPFLVVVEDLSFREEILMSIFEEELEDGYRIQTEKMDHQNSPKEKFLISFVMSLIGILIVKETNFLKIIFRHTFLVMLGVVLAYTFKTIDLEVLILIMLISIIDISNIIQEEYLLAVKNNYKFF